MFTFKTGVSERHTETLCIHYGENMNELEPKENVVTFLNHSEAGLIRHGGNKGEVALFSKRKCLGAIAFSQTRQTVQPSMSPNSS